LWPSVHGDDYTKYKKKALKKKLKKKKKKKRISTKFRKTKGYKSKNRMRYRDPYTSSSFILKHPLQIAYSRIHPSLRLILSPNTPLSLSPSAMLYISQRK
jgi:ribosomal protein L32E